MNGLYIVKDKISYINMLDECNREYSIYPDFVPFATPDNYEKLLDELKLKAKGINNDGIKDGKIVGSASIRLNPNDIW